jgi:hypothetical protein
MAFSLLLHYNRGIRNEKMDLYKGMCTYKLPTLIMGQIFCPSLLKLFQGFKLFIKGFETDYK